LYGCDEIGRRRAFERQSVPNVSHDALCNGCMQGMRVVRRVTSWQYTITLGGLLSAH